MKVLAKFLGRVNEFNEPPALSYVTLKNVDTGESVDTDAVSERLKEKDITRVGCEFEVLIMEDAGTTTASLTKLEPLKVSEAELKSILKSISEEVDAKLPSSEPHCYDI